MSADPLLQLLPGWRHLGCGAGAQGTSLHCCKPPTALQGPGMPLIRPSVAHRSSIQILPEFRPSNVQCSTISAVLLAGAGTLPCSVLRLQPWPDLAVWSVRPSGALLCLWLGLAAGHPGFLFPAGPSGCCSGGDGQPAVPCGLVPGRVARPVSPGQYKQPGSSSQGSQQWQRCSLSQRWRCSQWQRVRRASGALCAAAAHLLRRAGAGAGARLGELWQCICCSLVTLNLNPKALHVHSGWACAPYTCRANSDALVCLAGTRHS